MSKQLRCSAPYNPPNSDSKIDGMGYRVKFGDISIECDSLDEVDAVVQRFLDRRPRQIGGASIIREGAPADEWRELLQALTGLRQAGERGISSADLALWAGLSSPKGLSGKSRRWSRLLDELSIDLDDVMVHRLVARGTKRWFPAGKLKDAIRLVSRRTHIDVLPD